MPQELLKKYQNEICSNCCNSKCEKNIIFLCKKIKDGDRIKESVSAKCTNYKKKVAPENKIPASCWQEW